MRKIRTTASFYGTRDERGRRTRSHTGSSNARSDGARHILATTTRPTTSEEASSRKPRRRHAKFATQAESDSAATSLKCDEPKEHSDCASVQCDIDTMVSPPFQDTIASDVSTDMLQDLQPHVRKLHDLKRQLDALSEQQPTQTHPPTEDIQAAASNSNDDVAASNDTATDETGQPPPRSNQARCSRCFGCSMPISALASPKDFDGEVCWHIYREHFMTWSKNRSWSNVRIWNQLKKRLKGDYNRFATLTLDSGLDNILFAIGLWAGDATYADVYRGQHGNVAQKSEQTFQEYAEELESIICAGKPALTDYHERGLVDYFTDGLYSFRFQSYVRQRQPRTLREAVKCADTCMAVDKWLYGPEFPKGMTQERFAELSFPNTCIK